MPFRRDPNPAIKRLRWDAGLQTQKAFADHLGVPQPQVSDWENDRYAVLEVLTIVKIGSPPVARLAARVVGACRAHAWREGTHDAGTGTRRVVQYRLTRHRW